MARKNLLKGLNRPTGMVFEHTDVDASYGKFIAYPFERGYGATIGNSLRRILLSGIQGYAITAVRIASREEDGSSHTVSSEFEPIPHVVEDTPDIINALKQIRLALDEGVEERTVYVEVSGPKTLVAGDLAVDTGIVVTTPELAIATLMQDANLEFEVQIEFSRGYLPAENSERFIDVVGTIPIDALFSPITRVKYAVENTRVGQRTDYDKLVLEVWTDGTLKPEDAVAEAGQDRQGPLHDIHQLRGRRSRRPRGARSRGRTAAPLARYPGRGTGAVGTFQQLPAEREHPHDRRPDAQDRG